METIVIAALVVIVLVVSVIIFYKFIAPINPALECGGAQNPDTKCMLKTDNCKDAENYRWMPMLGMKCKSTSYMCCKKITKIS